MERIKLTKRGKEILLLLNNNKYVIQDTDEEAKELLFLSQEGLVLGKKQIASSLPVIFLTPKGKAYILSNPKLKNPSIWDDNKFKIATIISIITLILTIILFK